MTLKEIRAVLEEMQIVMKSNTNENVKANKILSLSMILKQKLIDLE